jgi:O-antigen/teichoic acid export membrane protein
LRRNSYWSRDVDDKDHSLKPLRSGISALQARIRYVFSNDLFRAGSWGLVDQAIVSGANFIVTVIAARILGPADFGVFTLMITVLTSMEATQRSLITTPHNVLGVHREGDKYAEYTSTLAFSQLGLASVFALVTLIVGLVFLQVNSQTGLLILVTSMAALAWQGHEFFRRILFTESRVAAAVVGDSTAYAGRVLLVGTLAIAGVLTGPLLRAIYALTWGSGAIIGIWNVRGALRRAFDRSVILEHWRFGRWLFASNSVSHLPGYVIAALLSSVLSVSAYGAYRAFDQLANSTNVPLSAMSNVLRPRISRQSRRGPDAVWRMVLPILVIGSAILLVFALVFILFRHQLIDLVYGSEYLGFTAVVFLIAFRPLLTLHKSLLTKILQAFHRTRAVFSGTAIGVAAGVTIGSVLIIIFELPAAGSIVIVSSLVTIAYFVVSWRRIRSDEGQWVSKLDRASATSSD